MGRRLIHFDWRRSLKTASISAALGLAMFGYVSLVTPPERWRSFIQQRDASTAEQREAERVEKQKSDRIAYLVAAAYTGDIDKVKSLIADGADVNGSNERFVTPLISAASGCQLSAVQFLLSRGADPAAETDEGFNAYDFAIFNNDVTIARLVKVGSRRGKPLAKPVDLSRRISEEVKRKLHVGTLESITLSTGQN
ncbi:MAG: ankyrin repeat domain-containing protein [Vulcanimicrobiaceae bacterium]